MSIDRNEVIGTMIREAPAILDTQYRSDRCIAGTRHALAVCEYFGIEAKPVKSATIAANQDWVDWMLAGQPGGSMPDEAWSVGIDVMQLSRAGGYPGHLVTVAHIDGEDILIDLALQQMARPHRGISLPSSASFTLRNVAEMYDRPATFALGDDELGITSYISYQLCPEKDWMHAKDWKRKPVVAGQLIRRIKEQVNAQVAS